MKVAVLILALIGCALAMEMPHDKKILGGLLCGVCKDIVKGGEKLGASEVEGYVHGAVNALCAEVGFLAHECEKELDKLVDKLIQKIIDKEPPETACKQLDCC